MVINSVNPNTTVSDKQMTIVHFGFLILYSFTFIWMVVYFVNKVHLDRLLYGVYISEYIKFSDILFQGYLNQEERYLLISVRMIDSILFIITLFYLARVVSLHWLNYEPRSNLDGESSLSFPKKVNKFFSTSCNGIKLHHMIASITLFSYFILYFRITYRMEEEGYISSDGGNFAIFLLATSIFVFIIESLLSFKVIPKVSLPNFIKYSDGNLAIMGFVSYSLIRFRDNESMIFLGVCLTFPMLFIQTVVLSGLRKFRETSSIEGGPSELTLDENANIAGSAININMGLVVQVILSTIFQLLSVFAFYFSVEDYNSFRDSNKQLDVINIYSIVYALLMIIIFASIHYLGSKLSAGELQIWLKRAVTISTILLVSVSLYDDFYFRVDGLMEDNGIPFFGNFIFLHIPVAILAGLELRIWGLRKK